ncbi:SPOSA6832_04606 [Sporobolomyces salmonicolor]|uniref:Elongation of fatty acids protein n=1 Tax=Sporidiobolus salmonicolor TaxID=5005 RepID=A0A0D6ESK5_SPOSA|nr:SPOSA6832_04606 [Sporobolomyces salmonicolor]
MDYETFSSTHQPRPSSFLASLKNAPKPAAPAGIPFPSAYDTFMNPLTPLLFGLFYFATAKTLSHYQNGRNRIQGKGWNVVVVAHNIFLAVYSGWTFLGTAPQVLGSFWRGFMQNGFPGLVHAFCDSEFVLWGSQQFPRFAYIFYVSKFYEIVDTAILLLKGKKVGMLQSYHHTGAIWTMYAAFRAQAMPVGFLLPVRSTFSALTPIPPQIWLFCCFNSFIHTLMYTYYALTAMRLPFPRFLKKSLTRMQITQFLVGGSLAASYLFISLPDLPGAQKASAAVSSFSGTMSSQLEQGMDTLRREGAQCLANTAQRAAVWLNVAYLIPLSPCPFARFLSLCSSEDLTPTSTAYLFVAFFVQSYRRGTAANKAAADAAVKAKKSA